MDAMICGLEGAAAYLGDVIVTARTDAEHCQNLEASDTSDASIIDKDGRRPDPKKTEVIRQMPVSKNVQEVRSYLGMVSYYESFVAEMHRLRALLDSLLKKNTTFK
ncbi:hypothetical protein OESDEN_12546 [Oesophagostomum dentatum]|uniref:Reverse transcriptase domain-containing protein n=1 Tax=Oesophagostomum dentatum TaxID=61180 RepID=A0A0B1SUY6_OESDE|nr:hypothetical protein OESDEN_12546 [Oesophagostomum dentatum]